MHDATHDEKEESLIAYCSEERTREEIGNITVEVAGEIRILPRNQIETNGDIWRLMTTYGDIWQVPPPAI